MVRVLVVWMAEWSEQQNDQGANPVPVKVSSPGLRKESCASISQLFVRLSPSDFLLTISMAAMHIVESTVKH